MRSSLFPVALVALAACSFDRRGVDDSPGTVDADPAAPDADPAAPDADPAAPDARPPDARPPDAAPPDAAPPDEDLDGIPDATDNCVSVANPEQYNEDGDLFGDACDNCPHVVNDDQVSDDGDLVGDECDPNYPLAGDVLSYFDGFNGTTLNPGWAVAFGSNTWSVSGGRLVQASAEVTPRALVWGAVARDFITIDVGVDVQAITPDGISTLDKTRRVGALTNWTPTLPSGSATYGRVSALRIDVSGFGDDDALVLGRITWTTGSFVESQQDTLPSPIAVASYTVRNDIYYRTSDGTDRQFAFARNAAGQSLSAYSAEIGTPNVGRAGPYTHGIGAAFRYAVIYTRETP